MHVQLVKIKKSEIVSAWLFQRKGFKETLKKYGDYKTSPATEGFVHFSRHFLNRNFTAYWVFYNQNKAGMLEVTEKDDSIRIARFCILKKYRNRRIGQTALLILENHYPDKKQWSLDTIFEEKNNLHLYEKLGYRECGVRKPVHDKMTMVFYEKIK